MTGLAETSGTVKRGIGRIITASTEASGTSVRKITRTISEIVDVASSLTRLRARTLSASVEISSIIGKGIGRTIAAAVTAITSVPGREINQLLVATAVEVAATMVKFPIIGRIYKLVVTSAAKTKTVITNTRTKLGW